MKTKQELEAIKVYAEHFENPISDLSGFNKLLKENGLKIVHKKTIRKLLNY